MAVESRPGMGGDLNGAGSFSARRIERIQLVAGGEPDVLAVIGDAGDLLGVWKRPILTEDFGCCFFHATILVARQRRRE